MATSSLASMSTDVLDRLQDPNGTFWSEPYEVIPALAEAISELLIMVGRPTSQFNQIVTIQPNVCFQSMPSGFLCITNINLNGSFLKKTTLRALDYTQSSWSSSWQSDRAAIPQRWAPLGLNMWIAHPAPLEPVTAQVTGIGYPFSDGWPFSGTDTSPFQINVDQALEMFAAARGRVKETGLEFEIGQQLYQQFLSVARRLTQIEDRRDSLAFTQSFGVPTTPSKVEKR